MISTGELRKGVVIELDGDLWQILDYHHIKMGRGSAQVRIKLQERQEGLHRREVLPGGREMAARPAGPAADPVHVPRRRRLPLHGDGVVRAVHLSASELDDAVNYMKDGMLLDRISYEAETLGVELPITVDLLVTETEPGFAGDTATGARKAATTETGLVVQVPFSWSRATRSGSTRAPASTRPGCSGRGARRIPAATARARHRAARLGASQLGRTGRGGPTGRPGRAGPSLRGVRAPRPGSHRGHPRGARRAARGSAAGRSLGGGRGGAA